MSAMEGVRAMETVRAMEGVDIVAAVPAAPADSVEKTEKSLFLKKTSVGSLRDVFRIFPAEVFFLPTG
ncbi:MAG: hypothetical protein LUH55_06315 [Bacteroides thetaiotaomicron]|nr:hypothetical protein [Bacteroides thetaiotaomicron]